LILQLTSGLVEVALYLVLAAAAVHLLVGAAWALRRGRLPRVEDAARPRNAARVTVQLPLRNEPR
jgi:hypothetical protein